MSTLLVTGATGKIATSLINSSRFREIEIIAVSRETGKHEGFADNVKTVSYKEAIRVCGDWSIDTFLLAGGITGNKEMNQKPLKNITENIECSVGFIHRMIHQGARIRKVIHLGSVTQYGVRDHELVTEQHCLNPITYYDQSKTIIENLLNQISIDGLVNQIWNLRLSNIYGFSFDNNPQRGFFDFCIRRLSSGERIQIFGDGNYLRDYLYFEDLLTFLKQLHDIKPENTSESLNIASGVAVTIRDAVNEIAEVLLQKYGKKSKIDFVPFPNEANIIDKRNFVVDIHKVSGKFEWKADVSLRNGIEKVLSRYPLDK